jgi:drug/metabolite transporter (DMT)-like permease
MSESKPFGWKVWLAFAIVYVVWGSTYLGIRYAIETLPPLLMAGSRFLIAGAILMVWSLFRNPERPTARQWRTALLLGAMMLLCGNGLVTLAEQRISSGLAALLIASEPLWLVLLAWAAPRGQRPRPLDFAGIAMGFTGVVLLVWPSGPGGLHTDLLGAALVITAAFSWAAGSIYGMNAPSPRSPVLANGMTMLAGGALLFFSGLARGEAAAFRPAQVSALSIGAFAYLAIFGSLVAFSAYTYLLAEAGPARASTYAFVNPVVAVVLGWALAGEPLSPRSVAAMGVIVVAVVLLTIGRGKQPAAESSLLATECAGD